MMGVGDPNVGHHHHHPNNPNPNHPNNNNNNPAAPYSNPDINPNFNPNGSMMYGGPVVKSSADVWSESLARRYT